MGSICRDANSQDLLYLPLSLSSVGYQWEPSCCQTHSRQHRAKARPVKLLKWHYSRQFFSLYLKCLNVWQTNQRQPVKPPVWWVKRESDWHPLPTRACSKIKFFLNRETLNFLMCRHMSTHTHTHTPVLKESFSAVFPVCVVTNFKVFFPCQNITG